MSASTPRTPGNVAPADAADAERRRTSAAIAMNRGFGESMGRGLELALTLLVFGAIGWFIDRQAGTSPIFTIAFAVVGFAGIGVKLWLGYDLEMRKHESEGVWNREADGTQAANHAPRSIDPPKETIEL